MLPDFIECNFDGSQSAARTYLLDRPDDCHPRFMLSSRNARSLLARRHKRSVSEGIAASGIGAHKLLAAWSASKAATRSQWSCQSSSMSHAVRSAMARAKSCARAGLQLDSRKATQVASESVSVAESTTTAACGARWPSVGAAEKE